MRLLGRTSSINVRKVLWTAREIGLAFEHEADWASAARPTSAPEFLALNPNGLVPVWVDDAGSLWESNAICRYLASRHGRRDLLPAEPYARALVERWMNWVAGDLNLAWRRPFLALVRRDPRHVSETALEADLAAWNRLMTVLDGHLASTQAFVAGDAFTLGDVAVGLAAHRWQAIPVTRPNLPHVTAYLARLRERPVFAALTTPDLP